MIIISDSKIEQLQHSQTLKLNVSSFLSLVVISFSYRHPLASQHYIYTCNSLFVNYCECHINVNGASVSEWAPLAVRVRVHLRRPNLPIHLGLGQSLRLRATGYSYQPFSFCWWWPQTPIAVVLKCCIIILQKAIKLVLFPL